MIRVAIAGYGNLGRGVEAAIKKNADMQLVAVFSRRDPASVKIATAGVPVIPQAEMAQWADKVDVLLACGGSAKDLPTATPEFSKYFNVIDSFDTHANIPEHFANVDAAAKAAGHISLISCGWDPGLFSLFRVYAGAVLTEGENYTFWGRGVSQGHSDAIRRVEGVLDARQYTVPVDAAVETVRSGETPTFTTREKHLRECYVVAKEGADLAAIEHAIKTMPNYFADYDTTVTFITMEELKEKHSGLPHGGFAIRNGITGEDTKCTMELRLQLGSNPEFTGSVLVACARAAYRMYQKGESGCRTMLDISPALLSPLSPEEQRATLL